MTGTQALLQSGTMSLPVNISALASHFGIKLVDYNSFTQVYDMDKQELYRRVSYGGFSLMADGSCICVLNSSLCGQARRKWTAAHEIGHILCGHISGEINLPTNEQEQQADLFAAELLAPLTVLHFCGVSSAVEIERLCGLSKQAAEYRFQELSRLRRQQDALYTSAIISDENAKADCLFLITEDQRELFRQYSPFISRYIARRSSHDGYAEYLTIKSKNRMAI